jgi:hypothetical protein
MQRIPNDTNGRVWPCKSERRPLREGLIRRHYGIREDRGRKIPALRSTQGKRGRQRYNGKIYGPRRCAVRLRPLVLGENEPNGLSRPAVAAGIIHSVRGWAPPIDV